MRRSLSVAAIFLLGSCLQNGPNLGDFCQRYVDRVAARLAYCNGGFADDWALYIDGDGLCAGVAVSVNSGRAAYHAELADSCLRIIDALACDNLAIRGPIELDMYCVATVTGQVGEKGACDGDRDCQLDFHCDHSAIMCPGTCRLLQDQNDLCTPGNANVCRPGLACIPVPGDGEGRSECTLAFDAGTPCAESADCAGQAFCDFSMSPAVCVTNPVVGPCPDDVPEECAQKSACVKDVGCVPALDAGAPCTVGNHECEMLSSCVGGVCTRWKRLGEPCGIANTDQEEVGCVQGGCGHDSFGMGTCVLLDAGEPCETSDECGPGGLCQGDDDGGGGAAYCHPRCNVR
jgi:hypothetical protein